MGKLIEWLKQQYNHRFIYHCTHPEGCETCGWCGFGYKADQSDKFTQDHMRAVLNSEL